MGLVICFVLNLYFFLTIAPVQCERKNIHHMMYETFDSAAACFRILNGTHQFGCSSLLSGNKGVVHFVHNTSDLDWLIQHAVAGPYMAVVHPDMFVRNVLLSLKNSKKVSGILLAVNGTKDRPPSFSPDDTCPNRYSGLEGSCEQSDPWNPEGTALLLEDWGMPIFVVRDTEVVNKIYECFTKFNLPLNDSQLQRSLCCLQMKGHMFAAVDSPTCIRRSSYVNNFNPLIYCDPMGDNNIISTLFPRNTSNISSNSNNRKPIILVMARMDSAAMFDGLAPSAMTSVGGIVTLLTTAHLLSRMLPVYKSEYKANVMFALLNGEAHDYIGSSRIVYDMSKNNFPKPDIPVQIEDFSFVIDINQVDKSKHLYSHVLNSSATAEMMNLLKKLKTIGMSNNVTVTDVFNNILLPPSSLQPFLKAHPRLPGVVLTNHAKKYVNRYYNGLMDNATNLDFVYANGSEVSSDSVQTSIASISLTLAQLLYTLVTDETDKAALNSSVVKLVDELLHCYLETGECDTFYKATSGIGLPSGPSSLYVGVIRNINLITTLTSLTLSYLTGKIVNLKEEECYTIGNHNKEISYVWINGESRNGVCVETTVKMLEASSPAFEIEGYNWSSGEYSTWTESVWQELSLRMYLKPAWEQEVKTLSVGIAVIIVSFIVVYWINEHADVLFSSPLCVRC